MLKLKLHYTGHLMWRADSLEKTLMLGKIEGRRRDQQRMRWLDGITDSMDHEFEQALGDRKRQGSLACCRPWGRKGQTRLSDWTKQPKYIYDEGESESCSVMSDSLGPHRLYSPWYSPGQNTGMGSLSLLQGIIPTQGSNPGLPHCRWILYQLSHRGCPRILEWVADPFSSGCSQPRNWTGVSWIAGGFFSNWAIHDITVTSKLGSFFFYIAQKIYWRYMPIT